MPALFVGSPQRHRGTEGTNAMGVESSRRMHGSSRASKNALRMTTKATARARCPRFLLAHHRDTGAQKKPRQSEAFTAEGAEDGEGKQNLHAMNSIPTAA